MPVTSTSEVLMPSGSELILMLLQYFFCVLQLATGQSVIAREFNLWLQPELGLTFRADNVNMFPRLLPREEKEPKSLFSVNSGSHKEFRRCLTLAFGGAQRSGASAATHC